MQYCRDEPALADHNTITDYNENNAITNLFKINIKITGQTGDNGTKSVENMVPLKYLTNFWRSLEMPLINCEININLKCSKVGVIIARCSSSIHFQ